MKPSKQYDPERFVWDTLDTDDDGHVTGDVLAETDSEYDVFGYVSSYRYDGGEKINHVPGARIVDGEGRIIHEAELHDSQNHNTAIRQARNAVAHLLDHYQTFV